MTAAERLRGAVAAVEAQYPDAHGFDAELAYYQLRGRLITIILDLAEDDS